MDKEHTIRDQVVEHKTGASSPLSKFSREELNAALIENSHGRGKQTESYIKMGMSALDKVYQGEAGALSLKERLVVMAAANAADRTIEAEDSDFEAPSDAEALATEDGYYEDRGDPFEDGSFDEDAYYSGEDIAEAFESLPFEMRVPKR